MGTVENELSTMQTELSEKVNNLEAALKDATISKEVITMLLSLECAKDLDFKRIRQDESLSFYGNDPGPFRNMLSNLFISREGFNAFISLLNSDEYLKGICSNDYFTGDEYFLTLGQGIILSVSFGEIELTKETIFGIFADEVSQNVSIAVDSQTNKCPVIRILAEDGDEIFSAYTTDEYANYNGQNLDDVLTPISVDVLTQRYVETLQKPKDNKTFKVKPIAIENK